MWSDKTLNMEAKPKIGQNQKSAGQIFGFMKFVNLDMQMEKLDIFIFANIVDPCSSVLKKQTTHKTKFYSFGYT